MSNSDGPRGFTVIGRMGGGEPHRQEYDVDNGTATAIYQGDLVKLETDGKMAVMAAASDDYGGVVEAVYDTNHKPVSSLAASTAGIVLVCDDPWAILQAQTEDGGTALTQAAIGDSTDAKWSHAGSGARAGVELDETLKGDGNSGQFRIIAKAPIPGNNWSEHYIKLHVIANEHAYKAATVAI